jgi:hypothetical protein
MMYGDEIRQDIVNNCKGKSLRPAQPGDSFAYSLIPDYTEIRKNIEDNLTNLARLKAQGQTKSLKEIWIIVCDIDEKKVDDPTAEPMISIYNNPDAQDVTHIIRDGNIAIGVFIIVEFQEGIEWVLLSPGDGNNIKEYNEFLDQREADELQQMFYIDFTEPVTPKTFAGPQRI